MKIGILTNEYPPLVYGGAGVHVEYLTKELAAADAGAHQVTVRCFGSQNFKTKNLFVEGVTDTYTQGSNDPRHEKFLDTMLKDIVMAGRLHDVDIVHCHTWYSHYAGLLARELLQVPLVLTTHSLEPHRPWKAEQLGSAYHASSWIEKTAYANADGVIAVSEAMKNDVHSLYGVSLDRIQVIHNGIDLDQYKPTPDPAVLSKYGIAPQLPTVLFVGRITRQKGIIHLVNAIPHLRPGCQIVLCAGAPDTPEIGAEMTAAVEHARRHTANPVIWIPQMVSKEEVRALYTHATVFVCPSVYEPFGIINLEAMACETPVVASAVGGIPEVVVPGKTGLLVPIKSKSARDVEPVHPEEFARDLAQAVNSLLQHPDQARAMGLASRQRVEEHFSWHSIAAKTIDFYRTVIARYQHH